MQVGQMPIDFTNFQFHHFTVFLLHHFYIFSPFSQVFSKRGQRNHCIQPGKKIARKVHVRLISGTRT